MKFLKKRKGCQVSAFNLWRSSYKVRDGTKAYYRSVAAQISRDFISICKMSASLYPTIHKAKSVKGRTLFFRDAELKDADFILSLRADDRKSKYLNPVQIDISSQLNYLKNYASARDQAYFIIEHSAKPVGTVRLYDARDSSFCWGSWILSDDAPKHAAIESTLMVYAYAIDVLGFRSAHFDVRKGNDRVLSYHERFGAHRVGETSEDYLFEIDNKAVHTARKRYIKFLPDAVSVN